MNRRLIDTNLIIRHLVQDHPAHARTAAKLFQASDRGDLQLVILPAVLAECVFVLESFYKHPRARIAPALASLLSSPGVGIVDLKSHLQALNRYQVSKLHFVDCLIAATAVHEGIAIATFDQELAKSPDVVVDLT